MTGLAQGATQWIAEQFSGAAMFALDHPFIAGGIALAAVVAKRIAAGFASVFRGTPSRRRA